MDEPALDFRFAWRALLPLPAGARVRVCGFSGEEVAYLRRVLPAQALSATQGSAYAPHQGAHLLLIDALRCPPPAQRALSAAPDIGDWPVVAVLADRAGGVRWRTALQAAFPEVREYALLPAAHPRVVVPLSCARHAVAGLGLHRPGRALARAGVWLARGLARVGHYALLRGRVLLIASRAQPGPLQERALYLGTADDNRKTVVLPVGESAPPLIFKIASTPRARASLTNEAAALAALAALGSPALAACVPRLHSLSDTDAELSLQQEYRARRRAPRARLQAAVVSFLAELAGVRKILTFPQVLSYRR